MGRLFLLFTVVPLIELFLLVRVGSFIGAFNTLLLVLATGLLGASLARAEGMRVVREWQGALAQGQMPADGVLSGLLVLLGGVLLITPGILTDLMGLTLMLPPTRRAAARLMRGWVENQIQTGQVRVYSSGGFGGPHRPGPQGGADPRGSRRGPGAPAGGGDPRRGEVIDTFGEDVT